MSKGKNPSGRGTREGLIESHLPLVRAVARRYAGRGAELDDLVQAGSVGLVKASTRFDPSRGVAFAAFATPTIEGEIRHHLRDRATPVRIPRTLQTLGGRIRRAEAELTETLGRAPSVSELAVALQVDAAQVEQALAAARARDPIPLDDARPDAGATTSGAAAAADSDDRLALAEQMRVLDERERHVVYLRFHGDLTEREIAREVGVSQAQVSRVLARALEKLRAAEAEAQAQAQAQAEAEAETGAEAEQPAPEPERRPAPRAPTGPGKPGDQSRSSSHSGRFLVRMPGELHEALAATAQARGVSLNRLVVDTLADTLQTPPPTPTPPPADEAGTPHHPPSADDPPARSRTVRLVLAANLVVILLAGAVAVALVVLALQQGL